MVIGGIDAGIGGAIAWYDGVSIQVKEMPKDELDLADLLKQIFPEGSIVYVEYQSMRINDAQSGKFFNTSKLIVNYKQCLLLLRMLKVNTKIISAHEWQKKYDLPKEYVDKKQKLIQIAKEQFPRLKPKLKTADAILILNHARLMQQYEK